VEVGDVRPQLPEPGLYACCPCNGVAVRHVQGGAVSWNVDVGPAGQQIRRAQGRQPLSAPVESLLVPSVEDVQWEHLSVGPASLRFFVAHAGPRSGAVKAAVVRPIDSGTPTALLGGAWGAEGMAGAPAAKKGAWSPEVLLPFSHLCRPCA
jgi:hypothetical protein